MKPSEDPLFPTWERTWRLKKVEPVITGRECYYALYGDGKEDPKEDPRCLADGLDGFGIPY
jgi:hypothetical protein